MPTKEQQRSVWFHLLDVFLNIVIIVAIVVGIRTFLVSPFQVEGSSMISTLENGEYIIINKLAYHIGSPSRGDVVVFRPPSDGKKYYVKRVLGIPGDTIILRDGYVYLQKAGETDAEKLNEDSYLDERNNGKTFRHPPGSGNGEEIRYAVPTGQYFLLGDNRQGSLDSRSFLGTDQKPDPFVPEDNIKGRVWFIALPLTKIHALRPPAYSSPEP